MKAPFAMTLQAGFSSLALFKELRPFKARPLTKITGIFFD